MYGLSPTSGVSLISLLFMVLGGFMSFNAIKNVLEVMAINNLLKNPQLLQLYIEKNPTLSQVGEETIRLELRAARRFSVLWSILFGLVAGLDFLLSYYTWG